jgi:hypothetical protein
MHLANFHLGILLTAKSATVEGIPNAPDLTQPETIVYLLDRLPVTIGTAAIVMIGLGIAIALIQMASRGNPPGDTVAFGTQSIRYETLIRTLQHAALATIVVTCLFLVGSTLANRYHYWESKNVSLNRGRGLEQAAPEIFYAIKEPYSYQGEIDGRSAKINSERSVMRPLALTGSSIKVGLERTINRVEDGSYTVNFTGEYDVKNNVPQGSNFILQAAPPKGYRSLQNFQVEFGGQVLSRSGSTDNRYPIELKPGSEEKLKITYRAIGEPQWSYNSSGKILDNFRLAITARVPNANPTNAIAPTRTETIGKMKTFTWVFSNNVAVDRPFGIHTVTANILPVGTIPRLLLLMPGIFLWWLLLLHFSVPLRLRAVATASFMLFTAILAFTYGNRIAIETISSPYVTPVAVWLAISIVLLPLVWSLGNRWRVSLAIAICTIIGVTLPVLALITSQTGVILAIAGLCASLWLAIRSGYGWYRLEPRSKPNKSNWHPSSSVNPFAIPPRDLLPTSEPPESPFDLFTPPTTAVGVSESDLDRSEQ